MLVALRSPYRPAFATPSASSANLARRSFQMKESKPRAQRVHVHVGDVSTDSTGGTTSTGTGTTSSTTSTTPASTFVMPTPQQFGVAAGIGTSVALLGYVGTMWTAHPLIGAIGLGAIGGAAALLALTNFVTIASK